MKYDLNGVHVLNKFIWHSLTTAGLMSEADYQGLVPIIPTQQEPVFNDMAAGKPFIVYTYVSAGYDTDIWSNIEQTTYRVFGDDERKLRQVYNFLVDLLKRYDWTADEVNTWLEFESGFPVDQDDRRFDFKYITVVGGSSPEPYEQEGGRQYSTVTVRLSFTHIENNSGLRS